MEPQFLSFWKFSIPQGNKNMHMSPERIVYVYRGMTQILRLLETEILMGLEGRGKYHRRGVA